MRAPELIGPSLQTWRPSRRSAFGALAAGATLLAACSGRRSTRQQPAGDAQSGKPRAGGQINQEQKYDPDSFDPSTRLNDVAQIMGYTNDSLLAFKTGKDIQYNDIVLAPSLADRWESPDAQTFTFHLHPGVTFANLPPVNGRPLTSADVKWTFEYLTRTGTLQDKHLPPAPAAVMFEGLDRVETPDANTAAVHFRKPFAPFLNYLASKFSVIIAHEIYDQDGSFSKRAAGSGPWQIDAAASLPGSRWAFKKNPNYFMPGLPYIDQVNWLILPDDATSNAAFQTRQIDMLDYSGLTQDTVQQIQKALPSATVYPYLDPEGNHIYLNLSWPPLNDERIRTAFCLCIDRDALLKVLSNGKGQWAVPGSEPGLFTPEEAKQLLPHDPAQAKQLVSAAGYANGVDIEAIYPGEKYGQLHITELQLLQSQLKPAGINLVLKSIDAATESSRKRSGDFQIDTSPKKIESDLDEYLYTVFYSKSNGNYGRINDAQLDTLLVAQRQEPDQNKRNDLWRQAVRYIVQHSLASALYYGTRYFLWEPYLRDYYPNRGYRGWPLTSSWIEK